MTQSNATYSNNYNFQHFMRAISQNPDKISRKNLFPPFLTERERKKKSTKIDLSKNREKKSIITINRSHNNWTFIIHYDILLTRTYIAICYTASSENHGIKINFRLCVIKLLNSARDPPIIMESTA